MSSTPARTSDKIQVVDRSTFNVRQQSHNCNGIGAAKSTPIRNKKYRRAKEQCSFNILNYLRQDPTESKARRKRIEVRLKIASAARRGLPIMWRGKQREGGRKKIYTRLKKRILRCRQEKLNKVLLEQLPENNWVNTEEYEASTGETGKELSLNGIHSRRFRDYCDNCTTPRLATLTKTLLADLNRFQRRANAVNEIKAHARRRFVLGFREVQSFMLIGKVKLLCIATDLDKCAGEAGLDSTITELKSQCLLKQIPYFFSLRRREIAYTFHKKVPISCVGILDYDGARDTVMQLLEELEKACAAYKDLRQKTQMQNLAVDNLFDVFEKKCSLT